MGPGAVTVSFTQVAVEFRYFSVVIREVPWEDVEEVVLEPGVPRPEWSWWAAFPNVRVHRSGRRSHASPGLLLVGRSFDRAEELVDEVDRAVKGARASQTDRRSSRGDHVATTEPQRGPGRPQAPGGGEGDRR